MDYRHGGLVVGIEWGIYMEVFYLVDNRKSRQEIRVEIGGLVCLELQRGQVGV